MVIPVVTVLVLYWKYSHHTVWWEFLIPVVVSVILITICKFSISAIQTMDTEYWGGWAVRAEYDEAWTEQCTRTVTDSEGHTHTETYYVYHPAEWHLVDSNQVTVSIDKKHFDEFCRKFGNKKFQSVFRMNQVGFGGNRYVTTWNGNEEVFVPVTTKHRYENRVRVSPSLFKFDKVSKEDLKTYELFDYPKISGYYQCPSILGDGGPTTNPAERLLTIANAKLGKKKEVRMWILVFKNQPLQAAFLQQNYWQGGNKNEFILAIGVDNEHRVEWCHSISWSEEEGLKVDARNAVLDQKGQPLDLVKVVNWVTPEIDRRFVRKHFSDFNYLTIEPPWWAVLITFGLTLGTNIGISYWIIRQTD